MLGNVCAYFFMLFMNYLLKSSNFSQSVFMKFKSQIEKLAEKYNRKSNLLSIKNHWKEFYTLSKGNLYNLLKFHFFTKNNRNNLEKLSLYVIETWKSSYHGKFRNIFGTCDKIWSIIPTYSHIHTCILNIQDPF